MFNSLFIIIFFYFFTIRLSSRLFHCFSLELLTLISCSKLKSYTLKHVLLASTAKGDALQPWELIKVLINFVLPSVDENPVNAPAVDVLFPGVDARLLYTILYRVDASSVDVLLPRVDARVVDMLLRRVGVTRIAVLLLEVDASAVYRLLRRVDVSPVDVLSHGGDEHVISIMNFTLKRNTRNIKYTIQCIMNVNKKGFVLSNDHSLKKVTVYWLIINQVHDKIANLLTFFSTHSFVNKYKL